MSEAVFDPQHAVITIDEQGKIVELDPGAEEVLGVPRSEAVGRHFSELRVRREPSDPGAADFESALEALRAGTERMVQMGTWDWSLETDDVRWSDNLYRLFGLEPGAIAPSPEYVLEHAHPQDRVLVERQIDRARRTGQLQPLDFRIVRADGELRHVRTNQAVVGEAGRRPRRIVGSVQDITDRRRAERMIAAHVAVAEALAGWQTFEQGATALLRNLAGALDCVTGVLWIPEGDALVARVVWHSDSTRLSELASMIPVLRPSPGVGLAGRAWETREPITALSLEDDPRSGVEAVGPLYGALALPARHGEEVLAVLELFCVEMAGADVTDRLVHSLAAIGRELGTFLGRRRGELKPGALTPRELEVLQLAAQGCAGRDIAERLVVSRSTVRTHFEHIYRKYGVSDRAAAVAKALREGLIE